MNSFLGFEEQGNPLTVHAATNDTTVIDVYDVIGGYNVNAADFRRQLNNIKTSRILVRINSPGGLVFDGIAMYNDLVRHPARVEVEVTGLAASAASIIAMAGDYIDIADSAFLMIHNAWVLAIGNRHEIAKTVDVLKGIDGSLARVYATRTGIPVGEIADMMDEETWIDGPNAVELGFADASGDIVPAASAHFDLSSYTNVPSVLVKPAEGTAPVAEVAAVEPTEDLSQLIAGIRHLTEGFANVSSANAHRRTQQPAAA